MRTGTIKAAARPDVRAQNSSREPVDSTLSSTTIAKKKTKVDKTSAKAGPTKALEMELWGKGCMLIAGTDEAGRGPLAGPVVAAACCIPQDVVIEGVADSKKMTEAQRESVYAELTTHPDITWAAHVVDARTIDEVNILQAAMLAMETSVGKLPRKPDFVLVDGNRLPMGLDPEGSRAVVKGDDTCYCIAAASVIAKVTRDRMMLEYDTKWPQYDFKNNKGYGTVKHMAAIRAHGAVEIHRRTFAPLKHMDFSHLPPP